MKHSPFHLVAVALLIAQLSCTDQDRIAAAIQDGKVLSDGATVPFVLYQNYPNPFNPATVIAFDVYSIPIHVRMKVYTEDWQEVATLVDRVITPTDMMGRIPVKFSVMFNANDKPSGEYYYTLEGAGVTEVFKMRLTK